MGTNSIACANRSERFKLIAIFRLTPFLAVTLAGLLAGVVARSQVVQQASLATIKAKIGSSPFEVAYDSGPGMPLDDLVALALGTTD